MTWQKDKQPLILIFALSAAILSVTSSCVEENRKPDKIRVVVSILPLADFAQHIGRDKIEVMVMVPPGANPHSYEPKPDQLKKVSRAKMLIKAGSGVEFELVWIDKLIQINEDMMVVNSSQGIELIGRDPHVWLSPLNAKKMVGNICEGLEKLDPANGEYYKANLHEYLDELDEIDRYTKEKLERIKNRRFIAYHPAWGYLAKDYDLEQIPIEHGGKEPRAERIKQVVEKAKEFEARVIFVSPQLVTKGTETVAREIGGYAEFLDPLPQNYISNMRKVVEQLARAMR